jgi:hypothetical protein
MKCQLLKLLPSVHSNLWLVISSLQQLTHIVSVLQQHLSNVGTFLEVTSRFLLKWNENISCNKNFFFSFSERKAAPMDIFTEDLPNGDISVPVSTVSLPDYGSYSSSLNPYLPLEPKISLPSSQGMQYTIGTCCSWVAHVLLTCCSCVVHVLLMCCTSFQELLVRVLAPLALRLCLIHNLIKWQEERRRTWRVTHQLSNQNIQVVNYHLGACVFHFSAWCLIPTLCLNQLFVRQAYLAWLNQTSPDSFRCLFPLQLAFNDVIFPQVYPSAHLWQLLRNLVTLTLIQLLGWAPATHQPPQPWRPCLTWTSLRLW